MSFSNGCLSRIAGSFAADSFRSPQPLRAFHSFLLAANFYPKNIIDFGETFLVTNNCLLVYLLISTVPGTVPHIVVSDDLVRYRRIKAHTLKLYIQ
jgi:hypothetical protein